MADEYYEDEASASDPSPEMEEGEDETPEVETALLPKSIFEDKELKPGNKCEFEIVSVFDDEVEVKYVKHDKEETPMRQMDESIANMESMLTA
jgi:hypothetical protein